MYYIHNSLLTGISSDGQSGGLISHVSLVRVQYSRFSKERKEVNSINTRCIFVHGSYGYIATLSVILSLWTYIPQISPTVRKSWHPE